MRKTKLNIYAKTSKEIDKQIREMFIDAIAQAVYNSEEFQQKLLSEDKKKIA